MALKEINIWLLLAGLGLFLFGIFMMEESLKSIAGRSFKKFLRKQTGNSIKAILSGTVVTAALQSSSLVSLLVMSFAGAGIIGLQTGIGIILGANLGTTMTGWLVSLLGFKFNIEEFILPCLAIGGLGIIFLKSEKLSSISKILMGFSFMFLGLSYMKNGFMEFADKIDFSFLQGQPAVLFILFAFLLTAAIQSSSAAIMIFLSSLAAHVISFDQAVYLVIGADLGTTITAVIGTINGNSIRKKVGWSQFYFNLFNTLLTLLLLNYYMFFIKDVIAIKDPLIALVTFHSLFNLIGIIVMLPFLKLFTRFINRIVFYRETKQTKFLSLVNPKESHAAVEALEKEAMEFLNNTLETNNAFFNIYNDGKSLMHPTIILILNSMKLKW